MTELFTLPNWQRAIRHWLRDWLLITQQEDGRLSISRYDDRTESSQYITSMSQEELQSLASYFAW